MLTNQIPPSRREADEDFDMETFNGWLELGFDEVRSEMLMDAGVNLDSARSLILVRGCPLEHAFNILL